MKSNVFVFFSVLILLTVFLWLMFTIANTGPKYKCIDGIMYENYMTGDVWTKTQKQCVEIK